MKQTGDGEMVARCVSTWQTLDSNYAVVKVLFKPDAMDCGLAGAMNLRKLYVFLERVVL
jgi:hypothetical protein